MADARWRYRPRRDPGTSRCTGTGRRDRAPAPSDRDRTRVGGRFRPVARRKRHHDYHHELVFLRPRDQPPHRPVRPGRQRAPRPPRPPLVDCQRTSRNPGPRVPRRASGAPTATTGRRQATRSSPPPVDLAASPNRLPHGADGANYRERVATIAVWLNPPHSPRDVRGQIPYSDGQLACSVTFRLLAGHIKVIGQVDRFWPTKPGSYTFFLAALSGVRACA
jgi:hypothetical protein